MTVIFEYCYWYCDFQAHVLLCVVEQGLYSLDCSPPSNLLELCCSETSWGECVQKPEDSSVWSGSIPEELETEARNVPIIGTWKNLYIVVGFESYSLHPDTVKLEKAMRRQAEVCKCFFFYMEELRDVRLPFLGVMLASIRNNRIEDGLFSSLLLFCWCN